MHRRSKGYVPSEEHSISSASYGNHLQQAAYRQYEQDQLDSINFERPGELDNADQ